MIAHYGDDAAGCAEALQHRYKGLQFSGIAVHYIACKDYKVRFLSVYTVNQVMDERSVFAPCAQMQVADLSYPEVVEVLR